MNSNTRTTITLIGSFLIFVVGMFRILTESLVSIPLVVAYLFAITGLIGVIGNFVTLRKKTIKLTSGKS
ncbi:hypothetical protein [Thalassobacillus sp. C254]|uniref:hypothetical protein n=1 Tax=Thalassobacillus sp. C254 TaxID=1225341 RepID=UPI0006CF52D9|nr:hypothetical protein [Thalassobacillus sp. C254]